MNASAGWRSVRLGDIAHVYSGGTPSRSVAAYWGGGIPWASTAEVDAPSIMSTKETISELGLVNSAAKIAPAGTLLMAMYGQGKTRGKTSMLGIDAAMNQACAAIQPHAGVNPQFLLAYLRHNYEMIRALSNAGGQENLSGEIVKKIPVVLPGSDEQERIAEASQDASRFIDYLERLIAKKQAIKQGTMQQLLTGKTRLPGFTGQWREVLLGNHVSYVKTVALSRAQLDAESPVRYLHYGDIHTRNGVTLDAAHEAMPRTSSTLLRNAGRLQVGDLVFADASEDPDGVGKSVEVTSVPNAGVVPGLHTIAARFDKAVLADGFKAYLQFIPAFRDALLRLVAGTKVLATTRSFISSITLTLPDVDEQQAIALVIADADREIAILRVRLAKARDVKQGMMQQLLTGRTRLPAKENAA